MFRMIQVTGESLSPLFHEGDYVLVTTIPFVVKQDEEPAIRSSSGIPLTAR